MRLLLTILFVLSPPLLFGNDHFSDRAPLSASLPISLGSTLQNATNEPGEPRHSFARKPYRSRWWTWTPAISGTFKITIASDSPHSLSLHTGKYLDRLLTLGLSNQNSTGKPTELTFHGIANQSYHISVATSLDKPSPFTLSLSESPPHPSNDHFANAIDLGKLSLDGDTILSAGNFGATAESGEPNHQRRSPRRSIWWKFTSPINGWCYPEYLTPFNGRFTIYQGNSLEDLTEFKPARCSCDDYPATYSRSPYYLLENQSYFLCLDDSGLIATNPPSVFDHTIIRFHFSRPPSTSGSPPPANDDFINATEITDFNHTNFTADISGATRETGERSHLGPTSHPKVLHHTAWWTWIAEDESTYALSKAYSSFYGIDCIIYQTSPSGAMTRVISHDSSTLTRPRFTTSPGLRYHAVIASSHEFTKSRLTANYQLMKLVPPTNLSVSSALDASTRPTLVLNEDSLPKGTPLFWTWKPPHDGIFPIDIVGAYHLSVFNGHSEDPADLIPPESGASETRSFYALKKDQIITIRAKASPSWIQTITVNVDQLPTPRNDAFSEALPLQTYPNLNPVTATINAITEPDEPPTDKGGTLWWYWIPHSPGTWTFSINRNTTLELFRGDRLANLSEIFPMTGTRFSFQFQDTVNPVYLRASNPNEIEIEVWQESETFNDVRSNAINLDSTLPASGRGSLYNASSLPGEPGSCNAWWTWTSASNHPIRIKNHGYAHLKVFEGTTDTRLADLVPVKSIFTRDEETVVFIPRINQSYLICAYCPSDRTLNDLSVNLYLDQTLISKGDLQSDPIDLGEDYSARFQGTSLTPFSDPNTPRQFLRRDGYLWLRWHCPITASYRINVESLSGSAFESFVLFSKNNDGTLTRIGFGDEDDSPMFVLFNAVAGTEYLIAPELDGSSETYFVSIYPTGGFEEWYTNSTTPFDIPNRTGSLRNDDITNLERFFFGLNSRLTLSKDPNASNLPRLFVGDTNLTLRYRLPSLTPGTARTILHTGEVSLNGTAWTPVAPREVNTNTFLVEVPIDSHKKYLRVRVWEAD